jgi:hypothetical protein
MEVQVKLEAIFVGDKKHDNEKALRLVFSLKTNPTYFIVVKNFDTDFDNNYKSIKIWTNTSVEKVSSFWNMIEGSSDDYSKQIEEAKDKINYLFSLAV